MAEAAKTTQAVAKPANAQSPAAPGAAGRGRPTGPSQLSPQEKLARARANLQREMDRATKFLSDGPTSYLVTARRAAKAGVPRETVEKGLGLIKEAVDDIEAAIGLAYAGPTAGSAPRSRGSL